MGTVAKKDDVSLRPGIVHRLDKDTTGVIVCAKNEKAHANLSAQFKAKTNKREYVGLISGVPTQKVFTVNSYLGRHPTHRTKFISRSAEEIENSESLRNNFRHAVTNIKVQDVFGHRLSFCNIQLQTGRTHQIRVHLSSVGFPIVGDYLYGSKIHLPISFPEVVRKALAQVTRQMLHANLLGFTPPTTGIAVEFRADLPQDFFEVLKILEPYKIT